MGKEIKIVVEHYPVERLPEELRRGLTTGETVRVTIEPEVAKAAQDLLSLFGAGAGVYSEAEAVSDIRALRDE
jgi:hypothetical protein